MEAERYKGTQRQTKKYRDIQRDRCRHGQKDKDRDRERA